MIGLLLEYFSIDHLVSNVYLFVHMLLETLCVMLDWGRQWTGPCACRILVAQLILIPLSLPKIAEKCQYVIPFCRMTGV